MLYRNFIEHDLINYAKENPGVVVYVKPRRHRHPILKAEYCKSYCFKEVRFKYIKNLKIIFNIDLCYL